MAARIGVIGLGYIGLPLVAAFASRGAEVTGLDVEQGLVDALTDGSAPRIHEPGVAEVLHSHRAQIRFTTSHADLVAAADVLFVTVGTPYVPGVGSDLTQVDRVTDSLAAVLRPGLTICLKSTVPPGTTRRVAHRLGDLSGLTPGVDFWVAFCPERTIEGRALEELLSLPNIVGGLDSEATQRASEAIRPLSGYVVPVDSPEVAEVCKLVDNSYRALAIAFANEVGGICERLGIDQHAVRDAVMDGYSRTELFRTGFGAGGPCLSKDPPVLAETAANLGVSAPVLAAAVTSNVEATESVARQIEEFVRGLPGPRVRVALLGLAFKGRPETNDVREGPAEIIYRHLSDALGERVEFAVYDPVVKEFYGHLVESLADAVHGAQVVALLNDHPALQGIASSELLRGTQRPLLVVDGWHGLADARGVASMPGVDLMRLGDGTVKAR